MQLLILPLLLCAAHHHDESTANDRFLTSRTSGVVLPLPEENDAFTFAIFGDRTGGPAEGIHILEQAVEETNLIAPDLVMTVGDLVQGYNETPVWLTQMHEFRGVMDKLACPWFPVPGNHDIYWRGKGTRPPGEHERDYEEHFGPLWYAFEHKHSWFVSLYSDEGDPERGDKTFEEARAQRMSPEQFHWLESMLERAHAARNVFLFLHHPRWLGANYGDDWKRVHELFVKAGNVRAVFAGHIHHMRYDGVKDGIEYFSLATVGGAQDGIAAKAGYLHEVHFVTVREDKISVAAVPVGSVMDPRKITGQVSDEVRALAAALPTSIGDHPAFAADGSLAAAFSVRVKNPTTRPVELTASLGCADSRWILEPDHRHAALAPGQSLALEFRAAHGKGELDPALRLPDLALDADYLAEGLRVPIPTRTLRLEPDPASLPVPPRPREERVLVLDGVRDALALDSAKLELPDGPLTIECWMKARDFKPREGLVCKTESSEFGLFVSGGVPEFTLHLDGHYVTAKATSALLASGRWQHLAGVFDGNEVRLYVDGQEVASARGSGKRTANALPLIIGGDVNKDGGLDAPFAGAIDEVRLSKSARYSGERFTPARRAESDADTLLLLSMDGDCGPWVLDSSGRAHHPRKLGSPALTSDRP